jgi:hypothetical protein
MKKKTYIQPAINIVHCQMTQMLCGSEEIIHTLPTNMGGTDIMGNLDPASRQLINMCENNFNPMGDLLQ